MKKAIGIIELPNCADAVQALDIMLKTAKVSFFTWEKKLGGRLVTIVIQGSVSAVNASVNAALEQADGNIVASYVIANPHEETIRVITESAKRQKFI